MIELKEKVNKSTIIVRDFNISSSFDKTSRKTNDLNNTIDLNNIILSI